MKYNRDIHPKSLLVKSIAGNLLRRFGDLNYPHDELIVVNLHSTPAKFKKEFNSLVHFLLLHFTVIHPRQLEEYYSGKLRTEKCALLFTFDDGLQNNIHAIDILNKFDIKACFFVIPGFIDTALASQKEYYLHNIRPVVNPKIDREPEDFQAMSWETLSQLARSGHMLGSHTYTHTLVAARSDANTSFHEIADSKAIMESKLNISVDAFCSINNTLESVGAAEKKIISDHYRYHFTTLPGKNSEEKDPLFIRRRNIECYWPLGAVSLALGKSDLRRWSQRVNLYRSI